MLVFVHSNQGLVWDIETVDALEKIRVFGSYIGQAPSYFNQKKTREVGTGQPGKTVSSGQPGKTIPSGKPGKTVSSGQPNNPKKTFPFLLSFEQLLLLQELGIALYELEYKQPSVEQEKEYQQLMESRVQEYNQKKKEYDIQMKEYYTKSRTGPKPNFDKPELPVLVELVNQYSPLKKVELQQTKKYKCFKALYDKGYWITSGLKFGGDWLLYPDNPNTCHSNYIVDYKRDIKVLNLISGSRLGTSVNKKRMYVWWTGKLESLVFEWSGWT
ncbi:tRNA-splicing endonuclease subunit Sen34 [Boothiomyces macroporosus]|uniref:tRNA-intron lyase n=1 Tax=Boothiomyces macroporosus TaxID=261099 RepID=A0AAD5UEK5_9FUNG|nr:tRNA-splicing endonuclease subunit Sen34 [Boothiomyces macroporosus]